MLRSPLINRLLRHHTLTRKLVARQPLLARFWATIASQLNIIGSATTPRFIAPYQATETDVWEEIALTEDAAALVPSAGHEPAAEPDRSMPPSQPNVTLAPATRAAVAKPSSPAPARPAADPPSPPLQPGAQVASSGRSRGTEPPPAVQRPVHHPPTAAELRDTLLALRAQQGVPTAPPTPPAPADVEPQPKPPARARVPLGRRVIHLPGINPDTEAAPAFPVGPDTLAADSEQGPPAEAELGIPDAEEMLATSYPVRVVPDTHDNVAESARSLTPGEITSEDPASEQPGNATAEHQEPASAPLEHSASIVSASPNVSDMLHLPEHLSALQTGALPPHEQPSEAEQLTSYPAGAQPQPADGPSPARSVGGQPDAAVEVTPPAEPTPAQIVVAWPPANAPTFQHASAAEPAQPAIAGHTGAAQPSLARPAEESANSPDIDLSEGSAQETNSSDQAALPDNLPADQPDTSAALQSTGALSDAIDTAEPGLDRLAHPSSGVPTRVEQTIVHQAGAHEAGAPPTGTPLREGIRRFLRPYVGVDPADARVHSDTGAQQLAHAFAADALTIGNDIFLGAGEAGDTPLALGLLAHELTHVAGGRQPRFVPPLAPTAPPADEEERAEQVEAYVGSAARERLSPPPPEAMRPVDEAAWNPPSIEAPSAQADRARWHGLPAPWEPLPVFTTAAAPVLPAPEASIPAQPAPALGTVSTPDAPIVARAAADRSPPSSAARRDSPTPAAAKPAPPDLDALARQVYAILKQRLATEQRRQGF